MPSLRDLLGLVCRCAEASGVSIGEQCAKEMEMEIRRAYGTARVHIPPPDSRKDSSRAEAIRKAAAKLPTGVVAERLGVSRQYVYSVIRRKP